MQGLSSLSEVNNPQNQVVTHGLMGKSLYILGKLAEQEEMKRKNSKNNAAIIQRDGIYMIRKNLETSAVKQDPALKELVDSVIG